MQIRKVARVAGVREEERKKMCLKMGEAGVG